MIVIVGARGMLGHDLLDLYGSDARGLYHDEMEITSPDSVEKVLKDIRPRVVINAVAYTDVDGCETNPERAFQVNGEGVLNLARVTTAIGAKLVQVSTDYVFDGSKGTPWLEGDQVKPLSVYGRSKLVGEDNARINPDHLIVRTQWLYGLHGKNFVETMLRLGSEKDELSVVNDQVGSPTWTVDLSAAIQALVSSDCRGTYHAANAGSCSWYEFAAAIFAESGFNTVVRPLTTGELGRPAPRPLYSVLNCGKLQRDTGFVPDGWREALKKYLKARRDCYGKG